MMPPVQLAYHHKINSFIIIKQTTNKPNQAERQMVEAEAVDVDMTVEIPPIIRHKQTPIFHDLINNISS